MIKDPVAIAQISWYIEHDEDTLLLSICCNKVSPEYIQKSVAAQFHLNSPEFRLH